jgi:hypothetical protein
METSLHVSLLFIILICTLYVEFIEYFIIVLAVYNFFVFIYSLSFILASYAISWLLILPCSLNLLGRLKRWSRICHNLLWSYLSANNSLTSIFSNIPLLVCLVFKNNTIIIIANWRLRHCLAISTVMVSSYRLIDSPGILIESGVV